MMFWRVGRFFGSVGLEQYWEVRTRDGRSIGTSKQEAMGWAADLPTQAKARVVNARTGKVAWER